MRLGVHHIDSAVSRHGGRGQVELAVGAFSDAALPDDAEVFAGVEVLGPLAGRAERLGPRGDGLGIGQKEALPLQRVGDLELLVECDQRDPLALGGLDLVLLGLVEGIDLLDRAAPGGAGANEGDGRERQGVAGFH